MLYTKRTTRPQQGLGSKQNSRNLGRLRDGNHIPKRIRPATPRLAPTDNAKGMNDTASGRGKAKRTMTALTTDSDSSSDAQRGIYNDYRHIRQVSPRFYHAPNPDDGTEPPFPPRIARNHAERRAPPPRPRTEHPPALIPRAQRESTPDNDDLAPLHTQLLIETTSNATLSAVNQHLMIPGLLPPPTVDSQPTELSLTRTAPPPSNLVQTTAPTPTAKNVQYLNHGTRYTQDGGLPQSANTASPTAFDHAFTARMQAEHRTLDTRRVP